MSTYTAEDRAEKCSVEECDRPSWQRGLCRGHYARQRRGHGAGGELRPYGRTPKEALSDAILDLLDLAPTDTESWRLAWKRIFTAVGRYNGRRRHKVHRPGEARR